VERWEKIGINLCDTDFILLQSGVYQQRTVWCLCKAKIQWLFNLLAICHLGGFPTPARDSSEVPKWFITHDDTAALAVEIWRMAPRTLYFFYLLS
jgi:hypothetical protein